MDKDRWVPLAEIARPHGVRGELRLKLFNTDSDVLLAQSRVLLRRGEGKEETRTVESARRANDAILMKLENLADRDQADELRGALVCVKRSDFADLGEGEFYVCDAFGAEVRVESGAHAGALGTVRDIRNYPTVDTLVVRARDGGHDWEIPLVASYVTKLDLEGGEVVISSIDDIER